MDADTFEFCVYRYSSVFGFENSRLYVEDYDVCGKSGSHCK